MTGDTDLAPFQVVIYRDPFDDAEEVARIDITGQVTGSESYAETFRERMNDEDDMIMSEMTDGRELLRYIRTSYTTGYTAALYNSERTQEIVQEFSDDEYEDWKASTDIDTSLED
jgi:hypothetical protein